MHRLPWENLEEPDRHPPGPFPMHANIERRTQALLAWDGHMPELMPKCFAGLCSGKTINAECEILLEFTQHGEPFMRYKACPGNISKREGGIE
jgi:hypothetical protein